MQESNIGTEAAARAQPKACRYGINAAVLKYLAVVAMLCDHIAASLGALPSLRHAYQPMRFIGRFAFPVYCFFIVEGFKYSRDRWKYLRNICIFAVLSQVQFVKAFYPQSNIFEKLNVNCTLALGLVSIWILDNALKTVRRRAVHIAAACLCIGGLCFAAYRLSTDYRYGGVLLIVLLYLLKQYRPLALLAGYVWICCYNPTEVYAFPAFLMLMLYNGKRGRQNKWFFYAFYPAHLVVLAVLRAKFGI